MLGLTLDCAVCDPIVDALGIKTAGDTIHTFMREGRPHSVIASDRYIKVATGRVTDDNHKILPTLVVTKTVVWNYMSVFWVTPYLD